MNPACAARAFCACEDCQSFAYDTPAGTRRGAPLTITAEADRADRGYTPTHRQEI